MDLEKILDLCDKKLWGTYDITVEGREHILPGKRLYAASHHHAFDPVFVGYTLARELGPVHYIAKSSLFKMPIFGKWLEISGGIPVVRPYDQVKHKTEEGIIIERIPSDKRIAEATEAYPELRQHIKDAFAAEEPIAFALAGTRTYGNQEQELQYIEDGEMKESGGPLLKLLLRSDRDTEITPVNVDVDEPDSQSEFLKSLRMLLGIPAKDKIPVRIMFGEPFNAKSYLEHHGNDYQALAHEIRDRYWALKK
jgi:1-acyl-sn-glycerol-3-phosphate acyltransferase